MKITRVDVLKVIIAGIAIAAIFAFALFVAIWIG